MEGLIIPGLFGAFLSIIGLVAHVLDRRQQRRHTKPE